MSQEEKLKNENDNVVIAFFADHAAADSAIEGIKNWDRINDHFELGSIGTIYKEGDKIKTKVGRKTGKGAKVGAVVGVIGAVLTGGALLVAPPSASARWAAHWGTSSRSLRGSPRKRSPRSARNWMPVVWRSSCSATTSRSRW